MQKRLLKSKLKQALRGIVLKHDLDSISQNFRIRGDVISFVPTGDGHINDTWLVEVKIDKEIKKYILQRINHNLFKNVKRLMDNIVSVTEFQRKEILERGGDPDRESLTVIMTNDGKPYYFDGENYYRMYIFIDNTTAYLKVENPKHFYESGVAFGQFANLLANFDASSLYESIPYFHDTAKRYDDLLFAIEKDAVGRAKGIKEDIDFALSKKEMASIIADKLLDGEIPYKVTHNDTKLNNVLIDNATDKAVCVIDLDTIMPGSICYDFGDAIRFGCNKTLEDEADFSKIEFDVSLFEEYTKGYLSALGDNVEKSEVDNLALGALIITYECGIRFLTDYLNGDTYFKIKYPEHNLVRARSQFALLKDMERKYDKMKEIVYKYYKK